MINIEVYAELSRLNDLIEDARSSYNAAVKVEAFEDRLELLGLRLKRRVWSFWQYGKKHPVQYDNFVHAMKYRW